MSAEAEMAKCSLKAHNTHYELRITVERSYRRPWYSELESALPGRRHIRFGGLTFRRTQDSLSERERKKHLPKRQRKSPSIPYPPPSEAESEDDGDSLSTSFVFQPSDEEEEVTKLKAGPSIHWLGSKAKKLLSSSSTQTHSNPSCFWSTPDLTKVHASKHILEPILNSPHPSQQPSLSKPACTCECTCHSILLAMMKDVKHEQGQRLTVMELQVQSLINHFGLRNKTSSFMGHVNLRLKKPEVSLFSDCIKADKGYREESIAILESTIRNMERKKAVSTLMRRLMDDGAALHFACKSTRHKEKQVRTELGIFDLINGKAASMSQQERTIFVGDWLRQAKQRLHQKERAQIQLGASVMEEPSDSVSTSTPDNPPDPPNPPGPQPTQGN
ncbi:unnamed protein product [Darwinula stevensoni]|uniref:Uncharacterized protein n=1 Tax=Darwinula stevensoni TaxID=69355 RepID=A0A7R8ZZF8_9CRUS|nr:unnamed protein product [Darwinula stevensoni]CAG0882450.1 unnamed protein product [Darwinula stevensoni]